MKKIFLLFWAVTLYCSLAYSQGAELSVIPRVDLNSRIPLNSDGDSHFGWQGTALYTLLEGSVFQEKLSYSICNHWLSDDPRPLYTNSWHTDDVTWVDWVNVTLSVGSFEITAGKDCMAIGSFEQDDYDFDSHIDLNSVFWNNAQTYQWGGKVAYVPSDNSYLALQYTTSPFGHKLNDNPMSAYALYWNGSFGSYSGIWSVNMIEYEKDHYISLLAIGSKVDLGGVEAGIDYINRAASTSDFFNQGMTLTGTLSFALGSKMECLLKAGYECERDEDMFGWGEGWSIGDGIVPDGIDKDYSFGGCRVYYYPLRNSRDLRLHASFATNNYADACVFGVGATYTLNYTLQGRK